MGATYVNRTLLFDERDHEISLEADNHEELFDKTYASFMNDVLRYDDVEDWNIEPVGFLTERFNHFTDEGGYKGPNLLSGAVGWNDGMSRILQEFLHLEPIETARFLETDDPQMIANRLQHSLETGLSYRHGIHREHESVLMGIANLGMPGFEESGIFFEHDDDRLCDFRQKDHGPGRRMLMEVAYILGP